MSLNNSYTHDHILSLLKKGDEKAFTHIYNEYWDKLYFLAHKHLKSAVAAEEIVQNVFVVLWNRKAHLTIESLPVYLAAMTRYAVYKHIAKGKKEAATALYHSEHNIVPSNLEEEIDNKLLLEIVGKLSNTLPEKCRLVFIYNKLLDQPLSKVAEQLNISQKTAEAHLTKALKAIRGGLGEALSILFIL